MIVDYGLNEEEQGLLEKCLSEQIGSFDSKGNFIPIVPMSPRVGISYVERDKENPLKSMIDVATCSLEIVDKNKEYLNGNVWCIGFQEDIVTKFEQIQGFNQSSLYPIDSIKEEAEFAVQEMKLILYSVYNNPGLNNPLIEKYKEFLNNYLSNNKTREDVNKSLCEKKFDENLTSLEKRAILTGLHLKLMDVNTRQNTEIQGLKDILILQYVQDSLGIKLRDKEPFWYVGFTIDLEGMRKLNNSIGPENVNYLLTHIGFELLKSSRLEDYPFRTFRNAGDEYGLIMPVPEMPKETIIEIFQERAREIAGNLIYAQLKAIQLKINSGEYIDKTIQN